LGHSRSEGHRIDVVAQVTKIGSTLVLDRVTGKSVYPILMRRAAVSKLPGEETWPYQPDTQVPPPFSRRAFEPSDVTNRTPAAHDAVMKTVSRSNLGWFTPWEEAKPTVIFSDHGGAEWTGACVDPRSGKLYVSSNEFPWYITIFRNDEPPRDPNAPPTAGQQVFGQFCIACHGADRRGGNLAPPLIGLRQRLKDQDVLRLLEKGRGGMPAWPQLTEQQRHDLLDFLFLRDLPPPAPGAPAQTGYQWSFGGWQKLLDPDGYPGCTPPWGRLNCIDLNKGTIDWQVPLGEYPELTKAGIPKTGTDNFGGATVTAGGLVFCAGTRDNKIRAFDAGTGAELWQHALPFTGSAPPASYELNGRQYIVVPATGGGKLETPTGDAYVAFALPR
jgi:quinoprotein glucose dehydrogenase